MSGINKVILVGRLGQDPEVGSFKDGEKYCNISLATSKKWKDDSGAPKESTEWHKVCFTKGLANVMSEYTKKGSQIYVEGSLKTTKYQKNGVDTWVTRIMGSSVQLLDSKKDGGEKLREYKPSEPHQAYQPSEDLKHEGFDDDIPF